MWLARALSRALGKGQVPNLPLPRLHHVTVQCSIDEVDACRAFYVNVLGLTELPSPIGKAMWYEEGVHIYWGKGGNERHPDVPPAPSHFALVLGEEYRHVVDVCKRWNMFLDEGTMYWGSPRSYIQDPAGNRIEIMEFAPNEG